MDRVLVHISYLYFFMMHLCHRSFEQTRPESEPVELNPLDILNMQGVRYCKKCRHLSNHMAKLQKDHTEKEEQMKTVHGEEVAKVKKKHVEDLSQVKKAHMKEMGQVKNECNDKIKQLRKVVNELKEDKKLLKRQCHENMEQTKEIRESKRGMQEEMKKMRSDHVEEVKQLKKEIEKHEKEMRMRSTEEFLRRHMPYTSTHTSIDTIEESIGHEAACNNKDIIKETKAIERTETIED